MGNSMTPETDRQFERETVRDVERDDVHFVGGMSLWVEGAESKVQPGEVLRLYGRGLGFPVRGVAVERDGALVVLRYESEPDYRARVDREYAEREHRKRAQFEAPDAVAARQARIDALPLEFQARIGRLLGADTERRPWSWLPYELFVCEQAVVIERAVPHTAPVLDAFKAFHCLPWEQQRAQVPGLDDGHSGNTFGMAVSLAYQLRMARHDPEWAASAVNTHGSLAVLGGPA